MLITKSAYMQNKILNDLDNTGVFIENEKIDFVDEFKYLGVIMDPFLKFDKHVNYIAKKISKKIGVLSRIRDYVSPITLITLYSNAIGLIGPNSPICLRNFSARGRISSSLIVSSGCWSNKSLISILNSRFNRSFNEFICSFNSFNSSCTL